MGRPGGGIMALRGHASIQGSTDIPTLYDTLPGYLSMPAADGKMNDLAGYLKRYTQETGLWHDTPKYIVSLLKAYYGARATKENDFGYGWLPRLTKDHSHFEFVMTMADHGMDGYFVMGQNPAVGSQNARLQRQALARCKWLVVRDLVEIETASFWYAPRDRARRDEDRGHRHGGFPLSRRLAHRKRRGVHQHPASCSSGAKKPFRRPAIAAAKPGSSTSSPSGLSPAPRLPTTRWTSRCARSTGGIPRTRKARPRPTAILAEINGWHTPPEVDFAPGVVHGT